jgi:histidine phosphotransfer protein HptB
MNTPDPKAFSLDINDPEDAELIEYFLGELPDRVDSITIAASHDDFEELGRIAHQLKGAAPGFGFPEIGTAAASLEGEIRSLDDTTKDIETVRAQVEGLVSLCQSYINKKP